ncbi:MAG: alpha/beta hydrolase [Anaerolineae bacterium]|nr:alpha/beta hydrolase [Anaerolineae bacterium]
MRTVNHPAIVSAQTWFESGERIGYDPHASTVGAADAPLKVFVRREGNSTNAVTFVPGYPDGSFGWAKVLPYLPDAAAMPKLFVEYVGMGDSDKPRDYPYSTAERTDLVEALWRKFAVQSTTLVAFDFSSLVVLEHLQRRLERAKRGEPVGGPDIRGVFIFNGGLFTDGHSHLWYTTPLLRRLPDWATELMARPFVSFKLMASSMWSRNYQVSSAEIRELYQAMSRHQGLFYLSRAAGFVVDHKAQGSRLDFGRLFETYHRHFPFVVGGSEEDPFEPRQVNLSQSRLGKAGLQIKRLPGGHLTTNEEPEALARLIAEFEQGLRQNNPAVDVLPAYPMHS